MAMEATGTRSESTRTTEETEASGELTVDQAKLLQMPALSSIRAQFPSVPLFGVPPTVPTPMSLDSTGDNGEGKGRGRGAADPKPDGKPPKPKRVRPDIMAVPDEGPVTPVSTSDLRDEWVRQLLQVIGSCSKIDVQLNGMTYSEGLRAELSQVKEQLERGHKQWTAMPAVPQSGAVAELAEGLRPLVLQCRRLQAKAQAMLREPAPKKSRKDMSGGGNAAAGAGAAAAADGGA